MTDRATAWSLTINNPTPSDEEAIALARQKGWKVEGQLEKGQEGTVHYQLMVKTPQVRFSAVKKAFPRANISAARNVAALQTYVHKEETRVGELPITQDKYPSLSKLWDLITDWMNDRYPYWSCDDKPITLSHLDKAARTLILQGYYIESLVVNPSTRSAWKNFGYELMMRSIADRQKTDRQTTRSEDEQSVVVETTNNADEDERSEEGLSCSGGDASSQSQDHQDSGGSPNGGYTEGADSCFGEEDD